MKNGRFLCIGLAAFGLGFACDSAALADVTTTGSNTIDPMSIHVGYYGVGTLTVDGGSLYTQDADFIGYGDFAAGTATVTGTGSTWNISKDLEIGYFGTGTLNIEAGGRVNSGTGHLGDFLQSTGIATVTGVGSTWVNSGYLYIGLWGSGALTVADGGLVTATSLWASISDLSGNGTITVSHGVLLDADVVFDVAHGLTQAVPFGTGGMLNLTVASDAVLGAGYRGTGTLRIADGVAVTSTTGVLGYCAGSSGRATVTGAGSTWTNNGYISLGMYGSGTLSIEAGGQVISVVGDIGCISGSTGMGMVTGDGSQWAVGDRLTVGDQGNGALSIQAGGKVSDTTGCLGRNTHAMGTATVTGIGSTWTNRGDLTVGKGGSGVLTIEAGGQVNDAAGILGADHGTTGRATVTGAASTWAISGTLFIGQEGSGMLEITAGGKVSNANGYLGYSSGSAGAVTVTGSGSQWISGGELQVGRSGSGMLSIIAGGLVSSDSAGIGDVSSGSVNIEAGGKFSVREGASLGGPVGTTGTATITGIGSIWTIGDHLSFGVAGTSKLTVTDGGRVTAGTLWASLSDLAGNGTITVTQGAMLDADMNFDASRGLTQILSFGSGGTLNLTLVPGCELGAGYNGTGTMRIADGMTVDSIYGCLGYHSGSTGKATVTGTGSTWSVGNSGYWLWSLFVGGSGSGILKIEAGGQVSSTTAYLGKDSGATGMVTVTGVDTNWTNTGTIYVGYSGASTLMVADGGKVTASGMSINSQSAVRVNVSGNGMIVLGDTANAGSFGNDGACSLYANAFLAANTYTPISDYADRPMNLTGAYLAYGGTWNSGALTFTVPVATLVTAGPTNAVSSGQRLVFSDPGSGRHVGISFGTVSAGTTVSAVYLAPEELEALPMPPAYVLSAWDFTTNFTGDQAMLAFDIGLGVQNPAVWRYDGSAWAPYTADLFTYDSAGVVSFIVNDFDGYAVVGVPVPEPATLGLLALGGLAILRRQAKRDRRRG